MVKRGCFKLIITIFILLFMLAAIAIGGFSAGCGYPDQERRHGEGDTWDVVINEDVTYSFTILETTKEDVTIRIENKNPEVADYRVCIYPHTLLKYVTFNDVLLEKVDKVSELSYFWLLPTIADEGVLLITYPKDERGNYRFDAQAVLQQNSEVPLYSIVFTVYTKW